MNKHRELVCAWYEDIAERIKNRKDWKLYINDHMWVLDIDNHYEFYFNPQHFIGKVEKGQLPPSTLHYLETKCKCFNGSGENREEKPKTVFSCYRLEDLRKQIKVGNWFYAQGYTHVTMNGRLYSQESLSDMVSECPMEDISSSVVFWDMLRMVASTKSHYYIRDIYDLHCFRNVPRGSLLVKPPQENRWDDEKWKREYLQLSEELRKYNSSRDAEMLRFMRKEVFQHTAYIVQTGFYYTSQGERVTLPDPQPMVKGSVMHSWKQIVSRRPPRPDAKICVENVDCLVAAKQLLEEGFHPAVLNMANRQNPGGGAYSGAGAQEENLFRRSNIYVSMFPFGEYGELYGLPRAKDRYPMDRNYGGVYSPEVTVFRGEEKMGYPLLEKPYQVGVISVAAMNRPALNEKGEIADDLVEGGQKQDPYHPEHRHSPWPRQPGPWGIRLRCIPESAGSYGEAVSGSD